MTGTMIGLNMKYLPWQLTVPIMFGLSIACMYYAFTAKGKTKLGNILLFFIAIKGGLMVIKMLVEKTGVFAQYLPIIETLDWIGFFIVLILPFVLYIVLL